MNPTAHELVFTIAERCFGGRLPACDDPGVIVDILVKSLYPDVPPEILVYVKQSLDDAVRKFYASEHLQFPL
jgi:hypothetical protein